MKNLANELRPKTLKEVVGQKEVVAFLNKLVEKKAKISFLLYGEPGIGKTSLAYAFCNDLANVTYTYFNAATGSKKQLQELIKFNDYLIIDEIHRLNRDKQDILLPAIEFGKIAVIATTTENPYFVVNPSVRSRMHILQLKKLSISELVEGMQYIIKRSKLPIKISKALLGSVAKQSNGDYRYCLNIVSLLSQLYPSQQVTQKILKTLMPSIHFYSDRKGDGHYDLLSAFHKSLRGSDVDACLYYLAALIKSGDLLGVERRMLAVAYEDVGLANPNVALRVKAAIDVAKRLGFPEAKLPLANAVIDLANALKSNSAEIGINNALQAVENGIHPIPNHLRDAHYKSAGKLGNGVGYKYPHDYGGYVEQQYLPDAIKDSKFFEKNKNDKV